jgi:maleylacetate reductase
MRMHEFHYTFYAEEVIFGSGAIARIGEMVERYGWRRLLLCTTSQARARGHIALVEAALGERLVATYGRVLAHVPERQVAEATALAAAHQVDAVIGLGGGSALGTAKAVSLVLEEQRTGRPARAVYPTEQPLVPVIAIPTTYAGSELTPVNGVTYQTDGVTRKITVTDPKVTPKLAIYDPQLTLDLPPRVTAGTGMNAMAHCIEALYSITRNPLSTAAALAGLRLLARALPRCCVAGDDLEARSSALEGAFLAGTALSNVAMGLHHGMCHVLGGTAGVAHGDANSVMLPHVMRFNLDATAAQLAPAAEALGVATGGQSAEAAGAAAADAMATLTARMGMPQRLRELGVRADQLPELARMAFASRTVQNNPKPIRDVAELQALLEAAW